MEFLSTGRVPKVSKDNTLVIFSNSNLTKLHHCRDSDGSFGARPAYIEEYLKILLNHQNSQLQAIIVNLRVNEEGLVVKYSYSQHHHLPDQEMHEVLPPSLQE